MAALTNTSADAILKVLYPGGLNDVTIKDYPSLAILKKKTFRSAGGSKMHIPVRYGYGSGASATFTNALGNTSADSFAGFDVTLARMFGVKQIDGLTLASMANDKQAFVTGLRTIGDSAFKICNDQLASAIFRTGYGNIGVVSSGYNSTVITLTDAKDAIHFEVGMEIKSAASASGALRTGSATVTAVDRDAGTITTDSNWNSQITSFANSDYLFVEGNGYNNTAYYMLRGFAGWLPESAPTSGDSWFGQDRSYDPQRLAGQRLDGSSYGSMEEALIDAVSIASERGASPDLAIMHPKQYRQLLKDLGSKVQYTMVPAQSLKGPVAGVSFKAVEVHGDRGPVAVVSDPWCQSDDCWILQSDSVFLASAGECPHILADDGNKYLRVYNADTYEVRVGAYAQLAFEAPGANLHLYDLPF